MNVPKAKPIFGKQSLPSPVEFGFMPNSPGHLANCGIGNEPGSCYLGLAVTKSKRSNEHTLSGSENSGKKMVSAEIAIK